MEYKKEPLKGYEEYQIDTNGVVYSKKGKPLSPSLTRKGYHHILTSVNGHVKGHQVHVLVANQFLKNDDPKHKIQVNHIDGNKINNNVDNLEFVTPSENTLHAVYVLGFDPGKYNKEHSTPIAGYNDNDELIAKFSSVSNAEKYYKKFSDDHRNIGALIYKAISRNRKYMGLKWYYFIGNGDNYIL